LLYDTWQVPTRYSPGITGIFLKNMNNVMPSKAGIMLLKLSTGFFFNFVMLLKWWLSMGILSQIWQNSNMKVGKSWAPFHVVDSCGKSFCVEFLQKNSIKKSLLLRLLVQAPKKTICSIRECKWVLEEVAKLLKKFAKI